MISKISRGSANVMVAGLLVVVIGAAATGYLWFKQPSIDAVVAMTPDDAVALAVFRGGPQTAVDFHLWELTDFLKSEHQDKATEDFDKLKEVLGFDPTSKTGILQSGFDVFEPLAVSVHMAGPEQPVVALYLPVSNQEKVSSMLERAWAEMEMPAEVDTFNEVEIHSAMGGVVHYAFQGEWLVAVASEDETESNELLKTIIRGDRSLAANGEWLRGMESMVEADWDLLVLANAGKARDVWGHFLKDEAFAAAIDSHTMTSLEEMKALGLSLDLEPQFFRYSARATVIDNATLKPDWYLGEPKDTLAASIPGDAAVSFRVAFDMEKILEVFKENDQYALELEEATAQLKELTDLDLEQDILARMGSPLSVAAFTGQSQATQKFGGALWLPLKDGHQMNTSLENITDVIAESGEAPEEEQVGETMWSRLEMEGVKLAWGVHQDHLVLVVGDPLVDDVVSGKDGASYLDSVKRPEIRAYLEEKGDMATYVNLGMIIDMFRDQMTELPPQAVTFVDSLDVMFGYTHSDETSTESEAFIYAKDDINFADVVKEMVSAPQ